MHAANWEHISIVLEFVAFVLVTPEFVGRGRLLQLSRLLFRAAARTLQLRDVQALIPPRDVNMTELRRRFRGLGAEIREMWGHPVGRQLILGVVLPLPAAIAMIVVAYRVGGSFRWLAIVPILVFAFGYVFFYLLVHGTIRLDSTRQHRGVQMLIVLLTLLPMSASIWTAFIPAWGLATVSERTILKGTLFSIGVLTFMASKGIAYCLVR